MTFSPGIVVAALLTVVIVAFGAYLGIQVLRFTKPPTIAVTQPATAVVDVDESTTTYTLEGTTLPGATVSIATPGREPYQVTAKSDGEWAAAVDLRRGRNQFDVTSLDPETGKRSEGVVSVFITVPFLEIEAPKLAVEQPSDGASFENGAIPVAGTATNAAIGRGQRHVRRAVRSCAGRRQGDTGPAARSALRDGHGRRRRHVQHALRADRRQVADHRHGLRPRRARPPP